MCRPLGVCPLVGPDFLRFVRVLTPEGFLQIQSALNCHHLVDKASVETCTKFTKCLMILYLYFSLALSTLTHKSRLPFGCADVGKDATAEEYGRGAILPCYTEVDVLYTVKVTVSQPIFHNFQK